MLDSESGVPDGSSCYVESILASDGWQLTQPWREWWEARPVMMEWSNWMDGTRRGSWQQQTKYRRDPTLFEELASTSFHVIIGMLK